MPAPTTLTDVLGRLADPNNPGTDKIGLVEYGTPADAAALDRFAKALRDSGYAPVTFEAADLTWAQDQTGNVISNVTIKGEVEGRLTARDKLTLGKQAKLNGDVQVRRLQIEDGASLNGYVRMGDFEQQAPGS